MKCENNGCDNNATKIFKCIIGTFCDYCKKISYNFDINICNVYCKYLDLGFIYHISNDKKELYATDFKNYICQHCYINIYGSSFKYKEVS